MSSHSELINEDHNALFTQLSQNLTDLFTYLEKSQETLCGTVEKLRTDKSPKALDEMEELIDGTFDEITFRHKNLQKAIGSIRTLMRLPTVNGRISSVVACLASSPLPLAVDVAASFDCPHSSMDDQQTTRSETADKNLTGMSLSLAEVSAQPMPLSMSSHVVRSAVDRSRDDVGVDSPLQHLLSAKTANQRSRTIPISDMPSTSFAYQHQMDGVIALKRSSSGLSRLPADVEAIVRRNIPMMCHVQVPHLDASALVDAEMERIRRMAQKKHYEKPTDDSSMAALGRLVDNARWTIVTDSSVLPTKRQIANIAVSSSDNMVSDEEAAEKSKKVQADRMGQDSSDDERQQPATRSRRTSAIAAAAAVKNNLLADEGSDVEKASIRRKEVGKRNGASSTAADSSKMANNGGVVEFDSDPDADKNKKSDSDSDAFQEVEDEAEEPMTRRPLTRSRVKDEIDVLLRRKVTLEDSDFDDDETAPERVYKRATKAVITRKRVYSSSSSEGVVALDDSDMDSDRSGVDATLKKERGRSANAGRSRKNDKTKRSKIACDSDDERSLLGSASENEELNESGKFRSRKIISKNKLTKTTVDAEKAEKERRERLKAKQKEFNGIEMSGDMEYGEVEWTLSGMMKKIANKQGGSDKSGLALALKALTLDKDDKSQPQQPVEVHPLLVQMLKPHQAEGIVFMYNSLFESIERLDADDTFGGILAHCMGLGKTFQVIAFLHTVMSHTKLAKAACHVMVVAPKNVVNNWEKEFQKWLADVDESLDTIQVRNISNYAENRERLELLNSWHSAKKPSVLIISYELFRLLTESDEDKPKAPKNKKPRRKTKTELRLDRMKPEFRKYLQDPGPDVIICDEGHKLKSGETAVFRTMTKIRTTRRLCLTGTPLQNNLNEYYTMISFVKPRLLGTKSEFANRFSNIITRGQTVDATPLEVRAMKRRCHVLYDYLHEVVQRRDYRVLVQTIPPKQEYVIYVRMTERQCALYREFLRKYCDGSELTIRKRLLPDYHVFARIWTHPFSLVLHERDEERQRLLNDDAEFVVSDEASEETEEEEVKSTSSNGSGEEAASAANRPSTSSATTIRRSTRQNPGPIQSTTQTLANPEDEVISGWYSDLNLISKDDEFAFHLGNKLVLLQQIIKKCEEIGDKLLVFSQSLETLRIIRRMLEYLGREGLWFVDSHEALGADGEEWGWVNGIDYLVIDGSVGTKSRDFYQDQFNDPLNLRTRLMLISTLAGSLGTNLVTANRVVIFDACWNPSHDMQAMFRVYRYGQMKPVYIYRLIAQGTMEERIYKRQVTKESMARRVTEEAQIQRHFRGSDLYELYQFDPVMEDANADNQARLAPAKDRLLADVILSHGNAIVSYLQHDSLFDEVEDEKLNESERLAAWEDYEREKKAVPVMYTMPTPSNPLTAALNNVVSGVFPIIPPSLPSHLVILPSNAQGLVTITAGARTDDLYRACFHMPAMTHDIAIRVLFINKLLDKLMPHIPHERRGGINEFKSYFFNIIRDSITKQHAPVQLLERSVNVFRTTMSIVRDVPKCMELIVTFNRLAPALFPTPQVKL